MYFLVDYHLIYSHSKCNYCKRYQIPAASLLNHNLSIDIFIREIYEYKKRFAKYVTAGHPM